MKLPESKLLIGRSQICSHLGISKSTFYELIEAGMPAKKIGRQRQRWIGNAEKIQEWSMELTERGKK